jgi:hypothetical protein
MYSNDRVDRNWIKFCAIRFLFYKYLTKKKWEAKRPSGTYYVIFVERNGNQCRSNIIYKYTKELAINPLNNEKRKVEIIWIFST